MANGNSTKESDVALRNVFRRADDPVLTKSQIVVETDYSPTTDIERVLADVANVTQLAGPNKTKIWEFDGLSPHRPIHTEYTRLHRLCVRYATPISTIGMLLLVVPGLAIMSIGGVITPAPVGIIMQIEGLRVLLAVAFLVGSVVGPAGIAMQWVEEGFAHFAD